MDFFCLKGTNENYDSYRLALLYHRHNSYGSLIYLIRIIIIVLGLVSLWNILLIIPNEHYQ